MAKQVGDPGSIIDHVLRLVAALRAQDWATVFALAIDIFGMITKPMEVTAGPAAMMAGPVSATALAYNLESWATKAKSANAIDWKSLIALVMQILAAWFKQPPAPTPTPSPAQA